MHSRLIGVFAAIVGIVGIAVSMYGGMVHPGIAERAIAAIPGGVPGFDLSQWKAHWWTWCVVIGMASVCWVLGGALILCKRAGGYVYVACATAGRATFPWALRLYGGKLFMFERASIPETLILLGVAAAAAVAFLMTRRANT
jgi:hypothetical protein